MLLVEEGIVHRHPTTATKQQPIDRSQRDSGLGGPTHTPTAHADTTQVHGDGDPAGEPEERDEQLDGHGGVAIGVGRKVTGREGVVGQRQEQGEDSGEGLEDERGGGRADADMRVEEGDRGRGEDQHEQGENGLQEAQGEDEIEVGRGEGHGCWASCVTIEKVIAQRFVFVFVCA